MIIINALAEAKRGFANDLSKVIQNYVGRQIDTAPFDKSFDATILGVNRKFVNISDDVQNEIIKKFNIPDEITEGEDNYYTILRSGAYYVHRSSVEYSLYDKVKVRVPDNDWSRMYLEVQRDTIYVDERNNFYVQYTDPADDEDNHVKEGDVWFRTYGGDDVPESERNMGRFEILKRVKKKSNTIPDLILDLSER